MIGKSLVDDIMIEVESEERESVTVRGLEFVYVPGGQFYMGDVFGHGSDAEKPVHLVQLSAFYLGRTPVTFDDYDDFCEAANHEKPMDKSWGRCTRPVINISWGDARAFCEWLSAETGEKIRLPTEAEWEYAARECGERIEWAGTSEKKKIGAYAWYHENSKQMTQPVGGKKPNALGLFDMSGNVSEWCYDLYADDYYRKSAFLDPQGPDIGEGHTLRGGSWGSNAAALRCCSRFKPFPGGKYIYAGFRCAMML